MLQSYLIGLAAGQRGIVPLAALATAGQRGTLPADMPLARLFSNPLIAWGAIAFSAAEMVGDKQKTAPDRIVPIGLAVRSVTSAYAGAALAPKGQRVTGAAVALGTALAASWVGWKLRCASMAHYGQTATGFVEDALVLATGVAAANPSLVKRAA
ncbi:DUF4126 domain-containing protein [Sphingomonas dokdonensis]|uniref:DUF4126 domain-containing protein n=1 Tax=Sphingomonas dokdonensis TaxID=344880 RepID=A0A245ZK60_9SPHN|nr:DUF4126 domain-containing protein [Sphingomonas dokdonensis]OWK30137.1 hypothetical protein SPDO_18190 [Sphingomonas dokdonensis]